VKGETVYVHESLSGDERQEDALPAAGRRRHVVQRAERARCEERVARPPQHAHANALFAQLGFAFEQIHPIGRYRLLSRPI
jgi:hypothetical protein